MPEIQNATSMLTISRHDIYDYRRCPKIVAIQVYRRTRIPKPQRTVAEKTETPRSIIGRLGEVATELALSRRARTDEEFDSIGEAFATGKTPTGAPAAIFSQGLATISLPELQAQIRQLPKNLRSRCGN